MSRSFGVDDLCKYVLVPNPLTYSSEADLKCFNRSVNSLLNVINGPNEIIQMHLLYANCVPIMTYASGIKEFPAREMQYGTEQCCQKDFLLQSVGEHSYPQREFES